MNKKYIFIFIIFFIFAGCETVDTHRQQGGSVNYESGHAQVGVVQPENAEKPAVLNLVEDGAIIKYSKGDILTFNMQTATNGDVIKSVMIWPQNDNQMEIFNVDLTSDTGSSYEDMVAQLSVFLDKMKILLWAGIGFLATGGIFAGVLRDFKSGLVLAGIGAAMLGGYALLPQIYSNWALILGLGSLAIPIFWWIEYRKTKRIAQSSIRAYERTKISHPEVAREMSMVFKEPLPPKDVEKAKKLAVGIK